MHVVVRHLLGVPVLALDDDVLGVLVQLQVDAAIKAGTGPVSAHVFHAVTLASVINREQRFQLAPTNAGQRIGAPVANIFESVHSAPCRNDVTRFLIKCYLN